MKISRKDAMIRKIDDALTIESLFDGEGAYLIATSPPFDSRNGSVS